MISSFVLLGKGCLRPAVAEIVSNRPLMILPKAFLRGLIGPYHPTVQGLIELASPDQPLTNPVKKRSAWDMHLSGQFGWPPFIRLEPLLVPNSRSWRFHAQLSLQR